MFIWRSIVTSYQGGQPVADRHAIRSGCGLYTVAKVACGERELFQAWRYPSVDSGEPVLLGIEDTAALAKSLAETDAGHPPSPQRALL